MSRPCEACGKPIELEREDYVRPLCRGCLPPLEPSEPPEPWSAPSPPPPDFEASIQLPAQPSTNDKRKQSLYLTEEMVAEVVAEVVRQDRSMSWLVQQAWRLARARVAAMPDGRRPQ